LVWVGVEITPDGIIDAENLTEESLIQISGILTLEEITATITLNPLNEETNETLCYMTLSVDGYLLFERNTSPGENPETIDTENSTENSYLSGIYETDVVQTMDSCDAEFKPWRAHTLTSITAQGQMEDGNYLINIHLNLWMAQIDIQNMLIAPDGTVNINGANFIINGSLAPDRITLTSHMYIFLTDRTCMLLFEISGQPLYERSGIPERFENR